MRWTAKGHEIIWPTLRCSGLEHHLHFLLPLGPGLVAMAWTHEGPNLAHESFMLSMFHIAPQKNGLQPTPMSNEAEPHNNLTRPLSLVLYTTHLREFIEGVIDHLPILCCKYKSSDHIIHRHTISLKFRE